jgi:polar amino acid transport system substrate-binding protein
MTITYSPQNPSNQPSQQGPLGSPPSRKPWSHRMQSAIVIGVGLSLALLMASNRPSTPDYNEIAVVTASPVPPLPEPPAGPVDNPDCRGFDGEKVKASYPPSATPTPEAALVRIRTRGKLIAGVSADTLLFGARNPLTGRLEGLDIDLVRALTRTIFPADKVEDRLQLRVITYANRLPLLEAGEIDVVAHTMTINCRRWNRIAFSSEYYTAGQQLMVKLDSKAKDIFGLPKKSRVCVPAGGTSVENLASKDFAAQQLQPVEVDDITQCLVLMQQGKTDAVLSDDTVVKGMARQDPYVKVIGEFLSAEPYGMGFNAADTDLVQVANAMLDQLRSTGEMDKLLTANNLPTGTPIADASRPLPTS